MIERNISVLPLGELYVGRGRRLAGAWGREPIRIEHAFRCLVEWVSELCNVRNFIEIVLLELYHTV